MDSKKIKDYVIEDKLDADFSVRKKEIREYTRGMFISLELGDSTGRIGAVMWEPSPIALT